MHSRLPERINPQDETYRHLFSFRCILSLLRSLTTPCVCRQEIEKYGGNKRASTIINVKYSKTYVKVVQEQDKTETIYSMENILSACVDYFAQAKVSHDSCSDFTYRP